MIVNDLFPDWYTGDGIFSAIADVTGYVPPWSDDIDASAIDLEFHGNVSGEKCISPLVYKLLKAEQTEAETVAAVASVIVNLFSVAWGKEYATLSAQYNPIQNYDMTEEMANDITEHDYGKSTTINRNSGIFAFNSGENAVPTGTEGISNTDSGTDTDTRNYTLTRSGNIGVTTSQQMLEAERNLWMWNFFRDVVFPDVNSVLAINIY